MEFNESIFYADMRRAVRLHVFSAVRETFLLMFLFSYLLIPVYFFFSMNNILWLYWIFLAVFIGLCFYWRFRPALKKRGRITAQFSEIDSDALAQLEKRYDVMSPEFNTLFLFDDYIYFPDDMLLIPYSEIAETSAEFPRIKLLHIFRVRVGASLEIRCVNGKKYSVNIRNKQDFLEHHKTFLMNLDTASASARNSIDYKELAGKNTDSGNSAEIIAKMCGKAFWFVTAKITAVDIIIMLAYWWFVSAFSFELGEAQYKAFMTISAAVDAVILIILIFRANIKRGEMISRTEKFSLTDLEAIKQGRALFDTVFMLDDCLWFFCENIAVDYGTIASLSTVYHISNFALLEIALKNKKKHRVIIKKWFEFNSYRKDFYKDIHEKINKNNFQEVQ